MDDKNRSDAQRQARTAGSAGPLSPAQLSQCLAAVGRSQDRAAFDRLFRHFAPRVKSYIMKLGSDAAQAEELMQETMVRVWNKAPLFDPAKASASTWIFTIARNIRIDTFRREQRPELDPDDPALVPDPEPMADKILEDDQTALAIRNVIATLPEEQQQLLMMSFYDDKPHSEIAEELSLPLGTVKSRLRLAMGKIRAALSGSMGELV